MRLMRKNYCALLMLLMASPGLSIAGENWDFIIAPYILIPSIEGDTSVGRVEGADLDVGPKDIVENLDRTVGLTLLVSLELANQLEIDGLSALKSVLLEESP